MYGKKLDPRGIRIGFDSFKINVSVIVHADLDGIHACCLYSAKAVKIRRLIAASRNSYFIHIPSFPRLREPLPALLIFAPDVFLKVCMLLLRLLYSPFAFARFMRIATTLICIIYTLCHFKLALSQVNPCYPPKYRSLCKIRKGVLPPDYMISQFSKKSIYIPKTT